MVILEGEQPLGADAHHYYDTLIKKFEADTTHVEHISDFWGDPLTASGAQSNDGKSAYVQVYLHGNMGETLANDSVKAVRDIVDQTPAPPGVKAYVTGGAPLISDQHSAGDKSIIMVTIITLVVIAVMLVLVFRSVVTMILILVMVFMELGAARGIVAVLGYYEIIGLSTFATSLLTLMVIAAGTDYAIFLIGRYQEARGDDEDRETSYYTMFRGTAHVVLGSGLTIAGAMLCLSFTRLPYFQTMGVPCAVGTFVAVLAALTLGPAVVVLGSRFGRFEPKRAIRSRGWRRIGTVVVRWPGPVLVATIALALVGLLALPSYKTSYDARKYLPADIPANVGYEVADRHFNAARMNPELMMIESDHDLRNSADFLVIDKIAKAIFHTPGISRVQTITRPDGKPIKHTTIPFQLSMQSTGQTMNRKYNQDRMADMLRQADEMQTTIDTMEKMSGLMQQMAGVTHGMVVQIQGMTVDVAELRDHIADFDDFFRPLRNYFYWEPHCFDIPGCWAIRSIFDVLDGVDTLTDDIQSLVPSLQRLDELMPQLVSLMPETIQTMTSMKTMMLTMYATQKGMQDQQAAMSENSSAMGEAFDDSMNDDSFYVPPEIFDNADFKRGMKNFISPDGHSVRFIISHEGDPATVEGISHIDAIKQATKEAIKGTPARGVEHLPRRHRRHLQGHAGRIVLRPADRRNRGSVTDFHHHVDHHPKCHSGGGDRGHGSALARGVVRALGAPLAAHPRPRTALDGARDVGDPATRGRLRLQPAAGVQVQGGDPRGAEDRHRPRDGGHRVGGDVGRAGLRRHHGVLLVQRPEGHGPGGYDDCAGPAVRHLDRPVVHDPRDRGAHGQVVLVAAARQLACRKARSAADRAGSGAGGGGRLTRTLVAPQRFLVGQARESPARQVDRRIEGGRFTTWW